MNEARCIADIIPEVMADIDALRLAAAGWTESEDDEEERPR